MLELVTLVKLSVISLARLPHLPEDLEPSLAQAAERTRVAPTFLTLLVVVGIRPRTLAPTPVGPQVNRVPQDFVAGSSKAHLLELSTLKADRGRAGMALQRLG